MSFKYIFIIGLISIFSSGYVAKDSEGINQIIALADEDDDRPIWITAWGGGNTF